MDTDRTARRRAFLINAAYMLFVIGSVLLVLYGLFRYLLPLVLAIPVAALLQKPCRWLEKRLCGGSHAAAGVLVGLLLTLVAAIIFFSIWKVVVWLGQDPAATLWQEVGQWQIRMEENMTRWEADVARRLSPELSSILGGFRSHLSEQLPEAFSAWLTKAAGSLASAALSKLPAWLLGGLVFVMAAVALTVEYEQVWNFFLRQLPDSRRKTIAAARGLCGEATRRLLKAYGLMMLVTFGELLIGFWLLGIDGVWKAAFLIALVDILPVLGAGTALAPWAVICLLSGETTKGVGMLILWAVISLVRRVLEPRVIGREMGLPPLVMLAVMLLGLRFSGFWGLLLYPVAAMLLRELHRHGYLHIWK